MNGMFSDSFTSARLIMIFPYMFIPFIPFILFKVFSPTWTHPWSRLSLWVRFVIPQFMSAVVVFRRVRGQLRVKTTCEPESGLV